MNLAELLVAVQDNLARYPGAPAIEQAAIGRWANQTVRRIAEKFNWESMEAVYKVATIAGQDRYAFPTPLTKDIKYVEYASAEDGPFMMMDEWSDEQMSWELDLSATSGTPQAWARYGRAIRFDKIPPISTDWVRVTSWNYPEAMTYAAATNGIMADLEDVVEMMVTGRAFLHMSDLQQSQTFYAMGEQLLKDRIDTEVSKLSPDQLCVTPGDSAGFPEGNSRGLGARRGWPVGIVQ